MGVMLPTFTTIVDHPPGTPLIGYDNVVLPENLFSDTADIDHPITNVANPATHLFWRGGVDDGTESIIIQTGSTDLIDYVGIAGHNIGSSGSGIKLEDIEPSPNIPLLDPGFLYPDDDSPLILRFIPSDYATLKISIDVNSEAPRIAVIYVGKLLVLERGIKIDVTHVPITFGRRTSVVNGMSETGNFLGRIVLSESRKSRAEFFGFTPDFYRQQVDPFLDAARETPFFWSWAPTAYPLETGYSWLLSDAEPEVSPDHLRIGLMLDMAGIA